MTNSRLPLNFVWIPMGLTLGARITEATWVYHALVILAVCLVVEKILVRHH